MKKRELRKLKIEMKKVYTEGYEKGYNDGKKDVLKEELDFLKSIKKHLLTQKLQNGK